MKKLLNLLVIALLLGAVGVCSANENRGEEIVDYGPGDPIDVTHIIDLWREGAKITIYDGRTLIAFPVDRHQPSYGPYYVKNLVEDIENVDKVTDLPDIGDGYKATKENWKVTYVGVYDNRKRRRGRGFGGFQQIYPKQGRQGRHDKDPHQMGRGQAYLVVAKYAGTGLFFGGRPSRTIFVKGQIPTEPATWQLEKGGNGVGLAPPIYSRRLPNPVGWLSQLSEEFDIQNVKGRRITFFNVTNQEWESYRLPFEGGGDPDEFIDRPIGAAEGFLVSCGENGFYTPDLSVSFIGMVDYACSIPEAVDPPDFALSREDGETIWMRSTNRGIKFLLEEAAEDDEPREVIGYWQRGYGLGQPPGLPEGMSVEPDRLLVIDVKSLPTE